MRIDYAKIIQTADKRREALQEMEHLLDCLQYYIDLLQEMEVYVGLLKASYGRVDAEGRGLLGAGLHCAMSQIASYDATSANLKRFVSMKEALA